MRNPKVASRYAKSLLHESLEKNSLDQSFEDMQLVSTSIAENRDLELMLRSPIIQTSDKVKVLEAVFAGKLGELSHNFVRMITIQGRETLLKEIVDAYISLVKKHKNIITAEVTSATALDDTNRAKIKDIITRVHKGSIELVEKVNPELIGGFILKVGDQMIDASVANKLSKLKRDFVGKSSAPNILN